VPGKPDLTKVTVSYNYAGTVTGDPSQSKKVEKEPATIFNNKISGEKLSHIYLFYYPLYGWKTDNIYIINNDNVPVVVHLVKQMVGTSPDPSSEENYRMNLYIYENNGLGFDPDAAATSLQTNLNVNIYNLNHPVNQATVKFNGFNCNFTNLKVDGIVNKEKKDRLFDIRVEVYQEGSATAGFPSDQKLIFFDSSKQD
jgi:hypothetical protein